MARFTLTGPDGQSYDVDATDPVAAHGALQALKGATTPTAPIEDQSRTLTTPSGRTIPYEVREEPDLVEEAVASPRNRGVERGLRQASDIFTLGFGPKLSDYLSSVTQTGEFTGPRQREAYRRGQALTEASRRSVPDSGVGQWTADVGARTAGGVAGLAALPLRVASPVVEQARRAGATLSDEAQRLLANLMPRQTLRQSVGEGARVGASFGAAGGVGSSGPDATVGETLSDMGVHMAGGTLLGAALPAAVEGTGRVVQGARDLGRYVMGAGPQARARASEWEVLGLEPPAVALLGEGGQQRAGRLAGTLVGGGTRESIAEGTRGIEGRLGEALGPARSASEAGGEAQTLVRRGLTARRSEEELNALGAEELEALSGVGRNAAPPVTPTTPEEILARRGGTSRRPLRERLAQAGEEEAGPAAAPTPARSARSARRGGLSDRLRAVSEGEAEAMAPEMPSAPPTPRPQPQAPAQAPARAPAVEGPYVSREDLARSEIEGTPIVRPRVPDAPSEAEVMARQAQVGPRRARLPDRPEDEPDLPQEARARYELQQRLRRLQTRSVEFEGPMAEEAARIEELLRRAQERLDRYVRVNEPKPGWLPSQLGGISEAQYERSLAYLTRIRNEFRDQLEGVRAAQRNTPRERTRRELEELEGNIRIAKIARWRQRRDSEQRRLEEGQEIARSAALHGVTREAEIAARLANAKAELAQVEAALERANSLYEAVRLEAQADTLRRQVVANSEHAQRLASEDAAARARGEPVPLRLPQRPESFREQVEAGERALAATAPATQQPLLDQPNSQLRGTLDAIALRARGSNLLPGYKSQELFSAETGELNPLLAQYLRSEVGDEVVGMLQRLALQHQRGQFAQGPQGTSEMLATLIRARARRGTDQRVLSELHGAIERDLEAMLGRTPEGAAWVAQRKRLQAVRAQIITELEEPLRAVMGTDVSPAQALSVLQRSAQNGGDIRVLQAFLRLAEAKGDRSQAASLVLQGLADGGLTGFLGRFRALSPEARQLLFTGPMAPLGARLERVARAGAHLERVAARGGRQRTVSVLRDLGAGVLALNTVPHALYLAGGAKVADSVLGSRWFARWLRSMPVERGPNDPGFQRQARVLGTHLRETYGLSEAVGQLLAPASAQAAPVSARAGMPATLEYTPYPVGDTAMEINPTDDGRIRTFDTGRTEVERGAVTRGPRALPYRSLERELLADEELSPVLRAREARPEEVRDSAVPRLGVGTIARPNGYRVYGKGSVQTIPLREAVGQHNVLSRVVEEAGGGRPSLERFQRYAQGEGGLPEGSVEEAGEAPLFRGGVRWGRNYRGAVERARGWAEQVRSGRTYAEIAAGESEVSARTVATAVRRYREQLGLQPYEGNRVRGEQRQPRQRSEEEEAQAREWVRRLQGGESVSEIARSEGVSRRTVGRRVGEDRPEPGGRDRGEFGRVQELWNQGVSKPEIARRLGVSEDRVRYLVNKYRSEARLGYRTHPTVENAPERAPGNVPLRARPNPTRNEGRIAQSPLDREAMSLENRLYGAEERLRNAGRSPEQIAAILNRQFGEDAGRVTARQIREGNVWWRQVTGEVDDIGQHLEYEDWMRGVGEE